jgi:hypothetical protein
MLTGANHSGGGAAGLLFAAQPVPDPPAPTPRPDFEVDQAKNRTSVTVIGVPDPPP